MSVEDKIREFILKNLYFVEDQALGDDVSFLNEGIIDSMGSLELVTFVESEFGIKVDMSEVVVKNFDSIGQLANFVRRKLAATSPCSGNFPPVEPAGEPQDKVTASAGSPARSD